MDDLLDIFNVCGVAAMTDTMLDELDDDNLSFEWFEWFNGTASKTLKIKFSLMSICGPK